MSVETVQFKQNRTVNQNRNASPNIWADCPWDQVANGEVDGVQFFDDLVDYNVAATQTTAVTQGRYTAFSVTAGQWISDNMPHSTTAGTAGGIISGLCDSDGDAAAIGTYACPFLLTTTQSGKLWFEARIATTSILTDQGQIFCGLCENRVAAFTATVPLGNGDTANTTNALIGFRRAEDGLGVLDTMYADHSATEVLIGTAANSTLAANTWIKLGMVFDPSSALRCVTFYVDGVECLTAMTKAALLATTYLDVACLGPCLAFFADASGTSSYLYLDWWRVCQTFS